MVILWTTVRLAVAASPANSFARSFAGWLVHTTSSFWLKRLVAINFKYLYWKSRWTGPQPRGQHNRAVNELTGRSGWSVDLCIEKNRNSSKTATAIVSDRLMSSQPKWLFLYTPGMPRTETEWARCKRDVAYSMLLNALRSLPPASSHTCALESVGTACRMPNADSTIVPIIHSRYWLSWERGPQTRCKGSDVPLSKSETLQCKRANRESSLTPRWATSNAGIPMRI